MAHTVAAPTVPSASTGFQPYVSAIQSPAEFTAKAVVIGVLFGLLFGASTVYLGLRAGLTVSASIPIAVLAISVLKKLGGSTILENNIVQTIGSAGESVAGGVVFTIPALIFLTPDGPAYFNYYQIAMLAFAGGILGVLMMVPLRRALIVKEHGVLPYPEGAACADVLIAGERGGKLASMVFAGVGVGALWKALSWVFNLFAKELDYSTPRASQFPNATLNIDISPEYMGVGYVIGPRIAGTMFAGGVLSWLVLLPLLSILGSYINVPFPPIHPNFANNPATGQPFKILEMSPGQLWSAYIRYIGAGAVLAAGLITLGRTLPTIVASAREGIKDFGAAAGTATAQRTERDLPTVFVLGGSLLLAIFLAVAPKMPMQGNFLAAILVVIFGFLFVTVSSRITGLIGTSSNPISGMTIATLILTCLMFVALGWTGSAYGPIALCVGAVVCIAAAEAGGTSQDLKTGFLVGATPYLPAARADHRGRHVCRRHRCDHALSPSRVRHRQRGGAGAAGDVDGDDHQGIARSEPALGPGAGRSVRVCDARALRYPLAVVRGRFVPADCDNGSDLRGRSGPGVRGAEDGGGGGIRSRRRHVVQFRTHRGRIAVRHSLRRPRRDRKDRRTGSHRQRAPLPARWCERLCGQRASLHRAGGGSGSGGAEEGDVGGAAS